MFGYVRPLKGELKVRQFEAFKAVYCGLCFSLRKNCGFAARFVVNYDFTFLAMLLSDSEKNCFDYRRCPASPFRKKCCVTGDPALDDAAYYSVILYYWKLRDAVRDESLLKSLLARLASLLLRRAYFRARSARSAFDLLVRENLAELSKLESSGCASLDAPADRFAKILEGAAEGVNEEKKRVLGLLLYHIGRLVYLLDAADDLFEDTESGSYNPLIRRFSPVGGELSPEDKEALRLTLRHSINLAGSAFELLDKAPYNDILSNIIFDGMPWVTEMVLAGKWQKKDPPPKAERLM